VRPKGGSLFWRRGGRSRDQRRGGGQGVQTWKEKLGDPESKKLQDKIQTSKEREGILSGAEGDILPRESYAGEEKDCRLNLALRVKLGGRLEECSRHAENTVL